MTAEEHSVITALILSDGNQIIAASVDAFQRCTKFFIFRANLEIVDIPSGRVTGSGIDLADPSFDGDC